MSAVPGVVSLLVFEAADCLMALPASEVAQMGSDAVFDAVDLGEYFGGRQSEGPWLRWGRGARRASLRVKCVVDVVPVALSRLTPMPALLRNQRRTRVFVAAGVRGDDVFLLLDPGRLA